jgi:hypothetical protein
MYDRIKDRDHLLLAIGPTADYSWCASEAISQAGLCEVVQEQENGVKVVRIHGDQFHKFPWEKSESDGEPWLVAGRVVGHDNERFAFVSGTEYFLFRWQDVEVHDQGPEAQVPAQLLK